MCACGKAEELGSLQEFSRPYAGEYQCRTLMLGGEDRLDAFESVKLTLGYDGSFLLTYRTAEGAEGAYDGTYRVNGAQTEITFTGGAGSKSVSRSFPMDKGGIFIELPFGSSLLYAEFRFP